MATLYVRLPERRDVPPLRTVDCSPSSSPVSPKLQVTNTTVIHQGNYATVYRGTRSAEGKDEDVVLKFVFGKCAEDLARLRAEHRVYQKMADLQGHCIPKCYGLFQAAFDSVACLVLEFCGEPLCAPFDEADMDLRCDTVWSAQRHSLTHYNQGWASRTLSWRFTATACSTTTWGPGTSSSRTGGPGSSTSRMRPRTHAAAPLSSSRATSTRTSTTSGAASCTRTRAMRAYGAPVRAPLRCSSRMDVGS